MTEYIPFYIVDLGTDRETLKSQLSQVPAGFVLLTQWGGAQEHCDFANRTACLLFGDPAFHPNSIQPPAPTFLEQLNSFAEQTQQGSEYLENMMMQSSEAVGSPPSGPARPEGGTPPHTPLMRDWQETMHPPVEPPLEDIFVGVTGSSIDQQGSDSFFNQSAMDHHGDTDEK